jgi:hypothetical protein
MPSKTVKAKKTTGTHGTRPLPGIITVQNVTNKDRLHNFMLNNPNVRVSPIVVPDQKYDPEYKNTSQVDIDSVFSPVTIPRERSLSDMENARRHSSPVTIGEYMSTINDEDDANNDWGHHNKNFLGGSKNRNKNKKKRATKKKLRNKKRQTRRKK